MAGAAALVGGTTMASAQSSSAAQQVAPAGKDLTPQKALDLLRQGNRTFLGGAQTGAVTGAQRRLDLARGQDPFAAYVSCSDSRVPPELLFGRGLGELFIIRNAGNTVDTVALGSIEYAVTVLGVPLVVVMGHESCGAVAAALKVVTDNATFPGSIGRMIEPIIPAVLQARKESGNPLDNAVRANVRRVVRQLREQTDPIMLEPQKQDGCGSSGRTTPLARERSTSSISQREPPRPANRTSGGARLADCCRAAPPPQHCTAPGCRPGRPPGKPVFKFARASPRHVPRAACLSYPLNRGQSPGSRFAGRRRDGCARRSPKVVRCRS